ncbi:MFS transporter [Massilia sp. Mn16-1_5]|uniref:MFS transporter n=1 Tax=Massilia sp. Mn16-1_5 TaxID=2079199 RepID=UPI00109E66CD|nr:MFS transporter [Massilia sp. Mn16-1_5]THC43289.1 arabinose ABC transporter permease [Massilia sp. Mn16-1_5]
MSASASPDSPTPSVPASLAPLLHPTFRMLWGAWLVANLCMWMNDVAAAWMMTSLTREPVWIALVQTASTLPVFLLGLPSGALADNVDRRRYFILTQFWVAAVAILTCVVVLAGAMTAPLLLLLTFANGIGLAMRWPVFAAIVPELVTRAQLPAALALNGVAMNASRIAGPLIAGSVIASLGTVYVFVLNAVLSVATGCVIMRWRREHIPNPLGREPLRSAIRVGVQFVFQSARVKAVLARIAVFFFHSTAVLALLPLVARDLDGSAATFTMLLAAMGSGAIVAVLFLPRLRQAMTRDTLVRNGALLHAAMTLVVALSGNLLLSMLAMFLSGTAWITTANSLSVSIQLALPDWVRARGMAIYQMALMGASALGAAAWGQWASVDSVQYSLIVAALTGAIAMPVVLRLVRDPGQVENLTPAAPLSVPVAERTPEQGRIVIAITYRIDPARADEFLALMQESRRSRLAQGALRWELLQDLNEPGVYVERIVDESWTEHLRRVHRVTEADVALRERKLALHIGEEVPRLTRRVMVAP